MIATLKFLHIGTMLAWCASLVALPVLLSAYGQSWRHPHAAAGQAQARFAEFRLITHYGYIGFATPAAILAIASGTALIFAAGVFDLWFAAKLALVCGMVLVHTWIGDMILTSGEKRGRAWLPWPLTALSIGIALMAAVLWLVLAKPDLRFLTGWMPGFMLSPWGQG